MFKTIIIVLAVTLGALIVMATVDKITTDITKEDDKSVSLSLSKQSGVEITISGEVQIPGTYLVPLNSTLNDALNAAGGVKGNADPKAYNVSFVLDKDYAFYIAPLFDVEDVCNSEPISKACINSDDKTTIVARTSLSDAQAQSIVEYRQANGAFKRIEDIQLVSGIGKATWEKAKKYITLSK